MSDARELVRARNSQFEQCFHDNKITELVDLYTADAKLMPPGQPIVIGKQAIKVFFQEARQGADGFKIIEEEVLELGTDTILERGKYNFFTGDKMLDIGKYVVILKKVNGKCFAYIDIFNSDQS